MRHQNSYRIHETPIFYQIKFFSRRSHDDDDITCFLIIQNRRSQSKIMRLQADIDTDIEFSLTRILNSFKRLTNLSKNGR